MRERSSGMPRLRVLCVHGAGSQQDRQPKTNNKQCRGEPSAIQEQAVGLTTSHLRARRTLLIAMPAASTRNRSTSDEGRGRPQSGEEPTAKKERRAKGIQEGVAEERMHLQRLLVPRASLSPPSALALSRGRGESQWPSPPPAPAECIRRASDPQRSVIAMHTAFVFLRVHVFRCAAAAPACGPAAENSRQPNFARQSTAMAQCGTAAVQARTRGGTQERRKRERMEHGGPDASACGWLVRCAALVRSM
jgi:hypothetical protein